MAVKIRQKKTTGMRKRVVAVVLLLLASAIGVYAMPSMGGNSTVHFLPASQWGFAEYKRYSYSDGSGNAYWGNCTGNWGPQVLSCTTTKVGIIEVNREALSGGCRTPIAY